MTIERAEALLPGGSELAFTGALTTPKKVPKFTGRIETASNNFRALLDWLGLDIASVPANRLRKMSFASDVVVAGESEVWILDREGRQIQIAEFEIENASSGDASDDRD